MQQYRFMGKREEASAGQPVRLAQQKAFPDPQGMHKIIYVQDKMGWVMVNVAPRDFDEELHSLMRSHNLDIQDVQQQIRQAQLAGDTTLRDRLAEQLKHLQSGYFQREANLRDLRQQQKKAAL